MGTGGTGRYPETRCLIMQTRNKNAVGCRVVDMTEATQGSTVAMTDDQKLSEAEIEAVQRDRFLADPAVPADQYPRLWNISAGMVYERVIRALEPSPPEYVTVPLPPWGRRDIELSLAITDWNLLWEAAQFRRRIFSEEQLPYPLRDIADRGDLNVVFVPRTASRYYEYAPLFHLLPRSVIEYHGLPLLRRGHWPYFAQSGDIDRYLPADFETRLNRAWAHTVWRHLISGSPIRAFSESDPIRLLAHNLDFWLPPVTAVIQDFLRGMPGVDNEVKEIHPHLTDGRVFDSVVNANPRMGTDLWRGEDEAAEFLQATVDKADADGRLRGILDAISSNRVEDDFSGHWSHAREDFERKLYRKRSKIKVRFVELTATIPVQGPETEVEANLVFADFLALLDRKEQQVVVLLQNGVTKVGDVASILGYKNHSPVSKRLARIRRKAAEYFEHS
jgi:hypothetical protein